MIKRLTLREQRIFYVCLLMGLIYIGFNGLYKPILNILNEQDKEIESLKRQHKKNLRLIRKGKAVENQYNSYKEQFKQEKSNELVMSGILSEIEEIASELELKISDIKPNKVRSTDVYNAFSVSLTMSSEFESIILFLYTLQGDDHQFNVEEVRFDKGSRRRSSMLKTKMVLSRILVP